VRVEDSEHCSRDPVDVSCICQSIGLSESSSPVTTALNPQVT
jgi:hypothetical protein